jgi:general L-amino acid transport system permease protein
MPMTVAATATANANDGRGAAVAAPSRTSRSTRSGGRSQALRSVLYQLVAVAAVVAAIAFFAHNVMRNMSARGIQSGFDFLAQPAGFDIGERLISFDSARSYGRAFGVGLLNTLRVAGAAIVLTTLLGTLLGIGRFSSSVLVRGLCRAYVEFFRNTPVLLQLLMWYLLMTELLPSAADAWQLGPFFLSKGGIGVPWPVWPEGAVSLQVVQFDWPHRGEFAIEGGAALTPEFMAVLLGLTIYTAAFVAEIVRAGILSVPRGQAEAAAVLGLNRRQTLRLVTLPQAMRVVVPPLTNQFLNVTKNSSLAVAIGYPELVSIANTSMNQTGRAVECIAIVMAIYLAVSLLTSLAMNRYNVRAMIGAR